MMLREHGIVHREQASATSALAKEIEFGHPVPVKWYQAVAEVLTMVYKVKKKTG